MEAQRYSRLPFTSLRKSVSVYCTSTTSPSSHNLFDKGVTEAVLSRCTRVMQSNGDVTALDEGVRQTISQRISLMGGSELAFRCVAFAFKPSVASLGDTDDIALFDGIESDLTFLGVGGMSDPPRADVRSAVDTCCAAGIRVMILTGDNAQTAEAIGR